MNYDYIVFINIACIRHLPFGMMYVLLLIVVVIVLFSKERIKYTCYKRSIESLNHLLLQFVINLLTILFAH